MILLFVYLFIALFVSFLCSIMESVLLSTPRSFLIVKEEKGNLWASSFLKLKNDIDKPLSAILSLNTVAHTVGAAGVGAQAVKVFGEASFGIVSAILTILILIITEIIPKTIGARYWRGMAKYSSSLIKATVFLTYPLVIVASFVTRIFSRKDKGLTTNREEIAALASIGTDEGVFSDKEDKLIQNILKLKNLKVKEIMTPRVVVTVADEKMSLAEFLKMQEHHKFSRIPIYSGNDDNISGYVLIQEVFKNLAEDRHDLKLEDIKREIIPASNSTALFTIWENLLEQKEHIALVVDEYGGMDGIVTMEDIIETLLGLEIVDEMDTVTDMQEYAREKWKLKQAKYSFFNKLNEK